jgi:hypothetical protein
MIKRHKRRRSTAEVQRARERICGLKAKRVITIALKKHA